MSEKNKSTTTVSNPKSNVEFKHMLDQVSQNFGYSNPFNNTTSRTKSQTKTDKKEVTSPRGATVIVIPQKSARKKEEDPE
jgi:hypothetical protein